MAEFAYKNAKYACMGYTSFDLNCRYYLRVSYEEDVDPRFWSEADNELTKEFRNLMAVYKENLQYAQEQKNKPTKEKLSLEVMLSVRKFS